MNQITDRLTSLSLEKQFLGGIYHHQETLFEIDNFFKETDMCNRLHEVLYSLLKQAILKGEQIDKVLWAQRYKNLNISTKDEINPFDYLESITFTNLNKKGVINCAKELVKLRIRRDLYGDANEVQSFVLGPKCSDKTVAEIVSEVDSIYNKRINSITTDEEPVDLFAGVGDYIKELATNPVQECGLITPFKQYNKFFGGLKSGDGAYVFSARLSEGKSVFLFNLAKGISLLNSCKILYIDSEMSLKLNMLRAGAAQAGINPWYLQTGKWIYNNDLKEKVLAALPEFNKYNGLFFHKYVPNRDIKEILGIVRKWFYKYVGRGGKALIVYDYLKIIGSSDGDRNEWQRFGDSVSYLNELGANLDVNIAIAAQQNRMGNQGGIRLDDDTTIGGSDRIGQFARAAFIFRRKTLDEITDSGIQFGTHLLKPIKWSRDQGEEDYNQNCYVKLPDGSRKKFDLNYINYSINYYHIQECGTLKNIVDHHNLQVPLDNKDDKDKDKDKSVDL